MSKQKQHRMLCENIRRVKVPALAATSLAALAVACNAEVLPSMRLSSGANERFFVGNFSGNISGFSAASGKLEPIPGSSITFSPSFLTNLQSNLMARFSRDTVDQH